MPETGSDGEKAYSLSVISIVYYLVLTRIKQYRGEIEGGFAPGKVENFKQETECRCFSFCGKVYSSDDEIPGIVHKIAKHISSPFFSIDMIETPTSNLRLIEIGDGKF